MNELVIDELIQELGIKKHQIQATLHLLEEGATIPFIARYRKEATGALDENQIKEIADLYNYYQNLLERKESVIRLIDEKGLLTPELRDNIMKCSKLSEVEDLYRPYKEKKKTKASEAIKLGLEPLAKKIMAFPISGSLENLASGYKIEPKEALVQAGYIIAEWISDNAFYRKGIRNILYQTGVLNSKKKKSAADEKLTYDMYYDFSERVKNARGYRILAMNRGEKEGVLSISISYDEDRVIKFMEEHIIKNKESFVCSYVLDCIKDSLKRLIIPSIEREIRAELTEDAEKSAIDIFKINLENLLMSRPLTGYRVMGFDPAFRTGCKLACLDEQGNVLHIDVIYPHEPKNDKVGSKKKLLDLIAKYNINLIAIGNGTASRESEEFVADVLKEVSGVKYTIVSEAGASVYSASKEAQSEFPDLEVQERSAISIGRRIQDPLSELVKIDPKSIGVGEYQHDVNQKLLGENLDFTVEKVVNEVGVNVNTASAHVLKYVSGLTKSVISKIMAYKEKHKIMNRLELKKIGLGPKSYEQAVGFLRIIDGENPLDRTGIHPESYDLTESILKSLNLDVCDIGSEKLKKVVDSISSKELAQKFSSDEYTVRDILKELKNPGIDPRDEVDPPILRSDVLKITDLKLGMHLKGTVRNVTSFGAFIDIGLKNDGLLHVSKMSKNFVSDPTEVVSVGNIVDVYVDDILIDKNKVSLTMLKN